MAGDALDSEFPLKTGNNFDFAALLAFHAACLLRGKMLKI
jgi:hypothetical protein